ncbi:MAG: GNAT family N-acetyltransferase [Chloroflexota bacterium]|nr:GNAT family N-acetyltransferase [Chloroflexota bacterium]
MSATIREARADEIESLIPILLQAEESESALRWSLAHLSDVVYAMEDAGQPVGAATLRWRDEPCELMELAIAQERHGQGLGKQFVAWLVEEAHRRGKQQMLVGTANSSINNIAFYQKCGFRMDHVRQDYFWYYRQPHYENGIQIRDMLVFRYDLVAQPKQGRQLRRPKSRGS